MSSTIYVPGVQNTPYGNTHTNPEASNYGQESAYSPVESAMIQKAVRRIIYDNAPKQFNILKLLYSKQQKDCPLDEFEYYEHGFGREALDCDDGSSADGASIAAAVAASPPGDVQQVVPVSAASLGRIAIDNFVTYPNDVQGIVSAIGPGNQITIRSSSGGDLPEVLQGQKIAISSAPEGDAQDGIATYMRLNTIKRYNYIEFMIRARRYGAIEHQKWLNAGRTNYLVADQEELVRQIRTDAFVQFFNGTRGEYQGVGNNIMKSTGGINWFLDNYGAQTANPTPNGLVEAFRTLAFATNHGSVGDRRIICATDELCNLLMDQLKAPAVRYQSGTMEANLNLTGIKLGTMEFTFVPCELFRNDACFPVSWQNRMFVLDWDTITPMKMQGFPMYQVGETIDRNTDPSRAILQNYKTWYACTQLGVEFNNPPASFKIDVLR